MAGGGRGYLTEARGKNNVRQDGVLAETRNGCITRAFGEAETGPPAVRVL